MLNNASKSHSHQVELLESGPGVLNPSLAFRPSSLHDNLCPLVWKRKSREAWLSEDQGSQRPESRIKLSRARPVLQDASFTGSSYLGQRGFRKARKGLCPLNEWLVSAGQRTSVGLKDASATFLLRAHRATHPHTCRKLQVCLSLLFMSSVFSFSCNFSENELLP